MSFRGFIAIDIKPTNEIKFFLEDLDKTKAKLKLVELENMHITLKFLGETQESHIDRIVDIMENSVKDIKPFNITLKKTGVFPRESYIRIIWIGISNSENLKLIADHLNENLVELGYKKEGKIFTPHLTVARVKNPGDKKLLMETIEKYRNKVFSKELVEKIYLKKSTLTPKGPIYNIIKEIKLG